MFFNFEKKQHKNSKSCKEIVFYVHVYKVKCCECICMYKYDDMGSF